MGKNITLVGGNGDGQTTKVANQIIVALTIEAVGEALLFASKAGADPARVRQALMGGFASSRILEVHGERMVKRKFDPGLPHRAAPEGSEPRAAGREVAADQPAQHRDLPGTVQRLRRPRRQQVGPLRHGARAGIAGRPRDRLRTKRLKPPGTAATTWASNPTDLLRSLFAEAVAAANPSLCLQPLGLLTTNGWLIDDCDERK